MTRYTTGHRWGTGLIWGDIEQPMTHLTLARRRFTLRIDNDMSAQREIIEGPQVQGVRETITYAECNDVDVSSTVLSGSPAALDANTIRLPALANLTAGQEYRLAVRFTIDEQIVEAYFMVRAED
jgi:hypothetical protein